MTLFAVCLAIYLRVCTFAPQQYQRCERKLDSTVTDICGKVDSINEHIDKVLEDAPTKLKVSVNVTDADWQKIQDLFDQDHKWMLAKMQEHIREVNGMFVEERRRVQKRYKEYDGCYLGQCPVVLLVLLHHRNLCSGREYGLANSTHGIMVNNQIKEQLRLELLLIAKCFTYSFFRIELKSSIFMP